MADHPVTLLRNSERSTYRRCRLKWHWSYNLRLQPERPRGALTFGTLVHEALAAYYKPGRKRGPKPAGTFEKLYTQQAHLFAQWDEDGERYDALELGIRMLEEYVRVYGKDEHIEILQPEMPIDIDVYDKQGNYLTTFVCRSDAAYRDLDKGRVGLFEHKTGKRIEEELRINTGYGEQGLSYWWAADIYFHYNGWLKEDEHLEYVLFNWLRKGMPDDRPRNAQGHVLNKDGSVSKRQPKPLLHRWPLRFGPGEMENINWRIRAEAWEMGQVRAGKLPLLKSPSMDCAWDCAFKEACELHSMGADYQSVLDLEFVQWNPYDDHELLEEKMGHG